MLLPCTHACDTFDLFLHVTRENWHLCVLVVDFWNRTSGGSGAPLLAGDLALLWRIRADGV